MPKGTFWGMTVGDWCLVLIGVGLTCWVVPKWWQDEKRFWRRNRSKRANTRITHRRDRYYQGKL